VTTTALRSLLKTDYYVNLSYTGTDTHSLPIHIHNQPSMQVFWVHGAVDFAEPPPKYELWHQIW